MDCPTLLHLLTWLDGEHDLPPPLPEHLARAVEAGWAVAEEAPDPSAEQDFEALRAKALAAGARLRTEREAAAGRPADDEAWQRVADLEREVARLRTRLLDAAALRQSRAGQDRTEATARLTWRGRELRDELQARAWRLQGVPAESFADELRGLRQALRKRAEGGRRMDEAIARKLPRLSELDRRAAALSLSMPEAFPELENDRVEGLARALTTLSLSMKDPPAELAALLAVHERRDAILARVATVSPLELLALALQGDPQAPTSGAEVTSLVNLAEGMALARGATGPTSSDVLLAAAGLPPDRLGYRIELDRTLSQILPEPDLVPAVSAVLLLGTGATGELLARWRTLHDALSTLYQGPAAMPAALLTLVEGPPDELLDDLRLAAEEIDRADLAVSGLEALVQGVRLLLAVGMDPLASRLLPTPAPGASQGAVAGLKVPVPIALASARTGLLLDAAVYRQVRRSYRVYHRHHPIHRSSGFSG